MTAKAKPKVDLDLANAVLGIGLKIAEGAIPSCKTRPIKKAIRRSKAEIEIIKRYMYEIAEEDQPVTVRQLFYRLVAAGVIRKSEAEYKNTVCRLSADMRRDGDLPYDWIADSTRWMRKPTTHSSLEAALENTARCYRRAIWDDQDAYVEVWLEKEALAGVLLEVTARWDVPLMVTRGYPSISYLYSAGAAIQQIGKPVYLYYFGDHDPSGVDITRNVEEGIREYAPDAEVCFERVAVTEQQIEASNLPTRPTKKSDSRAKHFRGDSVDVDAIPPKILRQLARECIEQHIDSDILQATYDIENAERDTLDEIVERLPEWGAVK